MLFFIIRRIFLMIPILFIISIISFAIIQLPAGDYELLVEEERLQGLSFEAYRRTATYLTVRGRGLHAGRSDLRAISDSDLKEALSRDQGATKKNDHSDAVLPPQEDGT